MKCSLFHAVGMRFELHRMFATLALLACAIGAQADDLLDVIQTKDVTVSWNEECGQPFGWQLSTNEDYMPGWMATEDVSSSATYLCFESSKPYTIAFDYVATIEDAGYIYYELESSNDDYRSESLYLSTKPRTYSISLESGWCTLFLYFENYNPDNHVYIYNFRVIACDHKDDTSEPTIHVDATCKHGSYDVHICSECGEVYNSPQANDKKDHVDADQDHECDVCGTHVHPDADKDGLCDIEGCGQVALETVVKTYNVILDGYCDGMVPSTNDNYKPGLMSGPAQYYDSEELWESSGELQLSFAADIPYTLTFDYVASAKADDGFFELYTYDDNSWEDYEESLSFSTTPQTFSKSYPASYGELSLSFAIDTYDAPAQLYIYNIRIVACDHSGDTSEPTRHVEATCAQGSHDVYTCTICGCEYDGPEANDKVKHTDADDDYNCDVCGAAILEKMFEISEGIEISFEPLEGRGTWSANTSGTPVLGIDLSSEESGTAIVTLTSPKDFTLSFDYRCSASTWDEEYFGNMLKYTGFSATLYDENGKNAWYYGGVDPIEQWSASRSSGSATIDLPAGTYYLELYAYDNGYRVSCDASVSNLKALYIESAIEKKAQDYQRFIMNHEDLDSEDSGIEDLNEDGKISVGDITIAIDRALKDEESDE